MGRLIDLTGQKFGRLTVIKRGLNGKRGQTKWLCRCDCGTEKIIDGEHLKRGTTKSCGCLRIIDIIGQKFGRWTVIERNLPNNKFGNLMWLCKCDCGTKKIVSGISLRFGTSKSCGCLQKEAVKRTGHKNGLTSGLSSMKGVFSSYKRNAKNRGISFKLTFEEFKETTQKNCVYCGAKPNNIRKNQHNNGDYTYNGIDRIDNNKGYIISNIAPCCKICNRVKRDLTLQEFKDWIERVHNNMFRKEVQV